MSKLDYKTAYKELYAPKTTPSVIDVGPMTFIMADGRGNPNDEEGEFQRAVELLYALTYTIKMSPKSGNSPEGYFEYVVPPLEGLWWMDDPEHADFQDKDKYCWTAMIRQLEFVTQQVYEWAAAEVSRKKKLDTDIARLELFTEGLCVQCMHIGPYSDEPATIEKMEAYMAQNGLVRDLSDTRKHHEIYLGDPRKTEPSKMRTILRYPVRKA